jgi:AraC-like DNA-binding protein
MTIRTSVIHSHYQVNSTTARTLLQYLQKKGLPLKRIQQSIQFEFTDLDTPEATLPLDIYLNLWELALTHTSDNQLGLRLALKPYNNEMSLVSHVFFNSENLREGLKQYIRYFSLINNAMRIELITRGDQAILQFICENPDKYCLQDMEHTLALSVMRIKEHFRPGTVIALDEVHFQHNNSSSSLYGKIFQCPVMFDQNFSALIFRKKYLEYTFPKKSTHLFNFLISHLEKLLTKIKKEENLKLQVTRLIEKSLASGTLDAEHIASQVHMSRHTLYRRLKAEGVSYHELVDEVRKNQAITLLKAKHHTLSEIAFLLGFSELSAFSRAFKKWTGQPPAKFKP